MGVDVAPKVNDWLQYQHPEGGFSTYIADDRPALGELMGMEHEPDFGFWESPQQCVSAVSLYTMQKLQAHTALTPHREALTRYMVNGLKDDVWEAYWWTSPVYTSSFAIKAAFAGGSESLQTASTRAIRRLQREQQRSGGWGDAFAKESPFYTGLMTDALCSNDRLLQVNRESAKAAVHWILNQQRSDGSWAGSDAMRLPAFRTKDLNSVANWPLRRKSLNVRSAEFNRVFSTAVCMAALNGYAKRGL
jgi:squalene-hopene/tetraprenyl-beta-curcumene cyclase